MSLIFSAHWHMINGPCFHLCQLAPWSFWNQHTPLYLHKSLKLFRLVILTWLCEGNSFSWAFTDTFEVCITILYICIWTESVHDFHVFESCFWDLFLPKTCFYLLDCIEIKTKHRYVIQTLACCLEKEKENSNSHQLSGYLKMQITSLICLIKKIYIYISIYVYAIKTLFL